MTNYLELTRQVQDVEDNLRRLKNKRDNHIGSDYIELAFYDSNDWLKSDADKLVDQLIERDYPYNRSLIKEIFDFSGFEYNEEHIDKARPDSQSCCDEWNEQNREDAN